VKVRASADEVLAILAPHVAGVPRDLLGTIRGAPLPPDGRDGGRRAVVYRVERDVWTTVIREGDRFAGCDSALARLLSTRLNTRAIALFVCGAGQDLAYDVFDKGESVASVLQVAGHELETHGDVDRESVARDPIAHGREWLKREDATNDRLAFRHFELTGTLRGRWDLSFERCVLLPELGPLEAAAADASAERRARAKTRKIEKPAVPSQALTREGERGVKNVLLSLIEQSTQGL
jgi:hypothetical protein